MRDAMIAFDVLAGPAWLPAALDGLNGLTAEWWMVPAGPVPPCSACGWS